MFKQKEGGGVKGFLNNVKKKLHFSLGMASLTWMVMKLKNKQGELVQLQSPFPWLVTSANS